MNPRNDEIGWVVLDVDETGEHDIPEQLDYWTVDAFADILSQASDWFMPARPKAQRQTTWERDESEKNIQFTASVLHEQFPRRSDAPLPQLFGADNSLRTLVHCGVWRVHAHDDDDGIGRCSGIGLSQR